MTNINYMKKRQPELHRVLYRECIAMTITGTLNVKIPAMTNRYLQALYFWSCVHTHIWGTTPKCAAFKDKLGKIRVPWSNRNLCI